jgi:uncharacterized protein YdaU (DUF1376 family)
MNYYSHHIGDFDRATRHLTRIERSIYRDLMDVYYDTEQPLTSDVAVLCRKIVARSEEEKAAVIGILDEFFITTPSGWYHERCEQELDSYRKTNSQKSAAGKASAAARAARLQGLINSTSTAVPTAVQLTNNQEPITKNHKPRTINQEPEPNQVQEQPQQQPHSDAVPASAPQKRTRKPAKAEPGTGKVWVAYATAYWNRYGVEPVRNAMVNGQLSNLVKRIGLDDAEHVAAFFVGHQHRFYVEKMHAVGLMLADCEKLRTEWATSTQMTNTRAVQQDRTQTNFDAFAPLIAEARAREAENAN